MNAHLIALSDQTFPIAGRCAFTTLLLLPVDAAQVDGRLTVMFPLYFKAFMADLDVQAISLVGPILNRCPLLPPNGDVFPLVVLPVLPLTSSLLPITPIRKSSA